MGRDKASGEKVWAAVTPTALQIYDDAEDSVPSVEIGLTTTAALWKPNGLLLG